MALVVPARNAAATLEECLRGAASAVAEAGAAYEPIVVDDGSGDATAEIARRGGARVLAAEGRGPGAARNLGWRAADCELVWFVDSDCVPERESLRRLLDRLDSDPGLAAAGGSYSNLLPRSLLATTIHEEIVARHARMGPETDHLGSFHLLVRRAALVESGGFDESRYNGPGRAAAEDLELSLRLRAAGRRLGFVADSRVGHYHPVILRRYLRSQLVHGFYATRVYLDHPRQRGRSSYSGWMDHLQPPLAVLAVGAAALAPLLPYTVPIAIAAAAAVFTTALPMASRLGRRRLALGAVFSVLSPLRALWRGAGMLAALPGCLKRGS